MPQGGVNPPEEEKDGVPGKGTDVYKRQVAHRVGSLTPGKDADVVVTSGHPLEWTGSVEHVFINGIQVK